MSEDEKPSCPVHWSRDRMMWDGDIEAWVCVDCIRDDRRLDEANL